MHICYIGDAGSIHVIKWAHFFIKRGHRVSLISDVENEIEGVEVFNIGECLPRVHVKYLSAFYQIWKKRGLIRILLNKLKPDIVHAHYATNCGFLAALSGYHPLALTVHGSDVLVDYSKDSVSRFFVTYALKRAEVITSPSTFISQKVASIIHKEPVTSQYGIDTARFRILDERSTSYRGKTVISTRYLNDKYDVETLMMALPLILERLPEAKFILVGKGEKKVLFENTIKKRGYDERVEFTGAVSNDRMPKLLNMASIYISTSPSDGLSISLLEAMACGLFPVVTDIPGNREVVVHGKNGLLFKSGDVKNLVDTVVAALKNSEMKNKAIKVNSKLVEERFSLTRNLAKVEDLYFSLTGIS